MDILVEEIELLIVKTAERNGGRRFYLFSQLVLFACQMGQKTYLKKMYDIELVIN